MSNACVVANDERELGKMRIWVRGGRWDGRLDQREWIHRRRKLPRRYDIVERDVFRNHNPESHPHFCTSGEP